YQPIIDVARWEVVGHEALMRWLHPQRGILTPAKFAELAEHSGLIVKIGAQILHESCRRTAQINLARGQRMTINVNVSPRQFEREIIFEQVQDALGKSNLAPELLCLEITEAPVPDDCNIAATLKK